MAERDIGVRYSLCSIHHRSILLSLLRLTPAMDDLRKILHYTEIKRWLMYKMAKNYRYKFQPEYGARKL